MNITTAPMGHPLFFDLLLTLDIVCVFLGLGFVKNFDSFGA